VRIYTVYELCIYIPDKNVGTLYTRKINTFAEPYRLSFLCIEGARVIGERIIYRRCCAIFWLQHTGTRADKKGNAYTVLDCDDCRIIVQC
jgi:hypothetical protein